MFFFFGMLMFVVVECGFVDKEMGILICVGKFYGRVIVIWLCDVKIGCEFELGIVWLLVMDDGDVFDGCEFKGIIV